MGWLSTLFYSKFKACFIVGFSGLGAGSIAIPVLTAGERFEELLFREFNPIPANWNFNNLAGQQVQASVGTSGQHTSDQSKFANFPEVKEASTAQLIKGTKNYNNGNYVIYFGSEACPNCNNFLYSEYESPKIWLGTDQKNLYKNGLFFETYSLVKHQQNSKSGLKDLKFIFFSDEVPSMANRNNDDLATIPWNKWSNTAVSQGKMAGDYIRYDSSAVKFRKIQSLLFYYFGEKAKGIPTIIIYKDGIPFIYGSDKLKGLENEKEQTGEQIKSLKDATAEETSRSVVLRYDLFKHLKYIFESEHMWYL